jgi:hypothetical protein
MTNEKSAYIHFFTANFSGSQGGSDGEWSAGKRPSRNDNMKKAKPQSEFDFLLP